MNEKEPQQTVSQTAKAGRNVQQVAGDYTNTTNFNFVFFLIGILALGGLAWGGLNIAQHISNSPIESNQEQQEQPALSPETP